MAEVLVSDLTSINLMVASQRSLGVDTTSFLDGWYVSTLHRLRSLALTPATKTALLELVDSVPWSPVQVAMLQQKLNQPPIDVPSIFIAGSARRVLQQCEKHFDLYLTDDDIRFISTEGNTLLAKVTRVVMRAKLIGLQHPSEQTLARMSASLIVYGFNTPLDEASMFTLFQDIKHTMKSTTCVYPHEYIVTYSENPAETLVAGAYTHAYGDGTPASDAHTRHQEINTLFLRLPMRQSSRVLQRIQQAQQLAQPHLQPRRSNSSNSMNFQMDAASVPNPMQQFMSLMAGMFQASGAHAAGGREAESPTAGVSTIADSAFREISVHSQRPRIGGGTPPHGPSSSSHERIAIADEDVEVGAALQLGSAVVADVSDEEEVMRAALASRIAKRPASSVVRRPAAAAAVLRRPAAAVVRRPAAAVGLFGCSKCRGIPTGCGVCREPSFAGTIFQR
jgi:hypothetical protein